MKTLHELWWRTGRGVLWCCWGKWRSEVIPEGGCERMWLRCGGVAENRVIMAMSAKCWRCLERKRRRRASKRRGENERERLWELLRGDQRVNGEKELFGLWQHDMLIIPPHISSISGCKTSVAWFGAVYHGFVNDLTQSSLRSGSVPQFDWDGLTGL